MPEILLECGCLINYSGKGNATVTFSEACRKHDPRSGITVDVDAEISKSWKREVAEVLKKHGKVDEKTVGRLALDINQGGIRGAIWQEKKID